MIEMKGKGCAVKMIEDSVSPEGQRLVTMQLRYWRPIHSELMTHRVFSRNASSSRAIPVAKMIEQVLTEPAMPVYWGKNQTGMSAREELTGEELRLAKWTWLQARDEAVSKVELLMQAGVHKQLANRLLEPWQFISVIVTATEWDNWFELRDHADAQPEIQDLARTMKAVMAASEPRLVRHGDWHLPYVTQAEREAHPVDLLVKLSAARCARVSYLLHDGTAPSVEKDLELFDRLVGSRPLHASPVEHQATPDSEHRCEKWGGVFDWDNPHLHGNFVGWIQHRKQLEVKMGA